MECQNTIKNLKVNKNKRIGNVIIIVEGEDDEFKLLKHIFTEILNYNYISMKRGKVIKHEFIDENNRNTVIIANTNSSSIKSIIDDEEYKDKLFNLLKTEYKKSLKNIPVYILWDRDKEKTDDNKVQEYYSNAINTFYSALDNEYEMNGLLLLSYPCHECFNFSNFKKRYWKETYETSDECKHGFKSSQYSINKINEKSLLLAVENMHHSMVDYNINKYDPTNFKEINKKIFNKEENCFIKNKYFNALSLISVMLIDLGIIKINDD